jgi:hypothetical protein
MSWDVLVLNYGGRAPQEIDEEPIDSVPLGPAAQVRKRIAAHLPGVDWSDPAWGLYEGEDLSIEFNAGKANSLNSIMLHVRGGGDVIPTLLSFATPNGWLLLDMSTTEFIDPENPSAEGWEGFQEYRDRVISRKPAKKAKPKKAAARQKKVAAKPKKAVNAKAARKRTPPGKRAPKKKR